MSNVSNREGTSLSGRANATNPRYWIFLLLIIAVGALTQLAHYQPTIGSDDQRWLIIAQNINTGEYTDLHPVYHSRILWTFLLALWSLGGNLTLEGIAPLLFILNGITAIAVAETARCSFGRSAGLIAASIYATHPFTLLYNTIALPDVLALTILSISVLLFARYIRSDSSLDLAGAAFLAGLAFSAKTYFCIIALPMGAIILMTQRRPIKLFTYGCLFGIAFISGVAIDFMLHYLQYGNSLGQLTLLSDYGERLEARSHDSAVDSSDLRNLSITLVRRFTYYLANILWENGEVAGLMSSFSFISLISCWTKSTYCKFLSLSAIVAVIFLVFMPAQISPLLFVEMQTRYLVIVIPILAVGGGGAIAAVLDSITSQTLALAVRISLVVALVYNAASPGNKQDRYRVVEFAAILNVLENHENFGVRELVFEKHYKTLIPDSYYLYDVKITFLDADTDSQIGEFISHLNKNSGRATFIRRVPYRTLAKRIQTEELNRELTVGQHADLVTRLEGENFEKEPVRVPYGSLRIWLDRFGIVTQGELVGWLYSKRRSAPGGDRSQ